jgi:SOS response regulatory protein OraA/RecX
MNNNKLIAEFMNHEYRCDAHGNTYNNSWDWLMPVVESCFERLDARDTSADEIKKQLATCHIDYVYNQVVEFIKQYNDEQ